MKSNNNSNRILYLNLLAIILLQNRRGYAIARYCIECGELTNCNYCSVSLTYHKQKNVMMCHYCNFSINHKSQCYNCNSINLELSGSGTQKIEEELAYPCQIKVTVIRESRSIEYAR